MSANGAATSVAESGRAISIARVWIFFLCFGFAINCAAQDDVLYGVTVRENFGGGYDAATLSESSAAKFESIGHFQYLRYKGKKLCTLGDYALSPDKRFIAFQGSRESGIFLLDKKTHSLVVVASKFPGLVREFDWKAKEGFLTIRIHPKKKWRAETVLVVPLRVQGATRYKVQESTSFRGQDLNLEKPIQGK